MYNAQISFDHKCNKNILIKKVDTLNAKFCICKDSNNEVKSCCYCKKLENNKRIYNEDFIKKGGEIVRGMEAKEFKF